MVVKTISLFQSVKGEVLAALEELAVQCSVVYSFIACKIYVQYNTVQNSAEQYSTVQYSTIQYNTVQFNTIQYSSFVHSLMASKPR